VKRRVKTHTAKAQDSPTPVPWRWRSRAARITGSHRPRQRPVLAVPRWLRLLPDSVRCLTPGGFASPIRGPPSRAEEVQGALKQAGAGGRTAPAPGAPPAGAFPRHVARRPSGRAAHRRARRCTGLGRPPSWPAAPARLANSPARRGPRRRGSGRGGGGWAARALVCGTSQRSYPAWRPTRRASCFRLAILLSPPYRERFWIFLFLLTFQKHDTILSNMINMVMNACACCCRAWGSSRAFRRAAFRAG
jgi:hypothetical protein